MGSLCFKHPGESRPTQTGAQDEFRQMSSASLVDDSAESFAALTPSRYCTLGRMPDLTALLDAAVAGDPKAAGELFPLVYNELRKLASVRMAQEKPGQTLQATALVHEAYVRLVDVERPQKFSSRSHFFAAAAEAMRRILIEAARRKQAEKHGGGRVRVDLPDDLAAFGASPDDLVALDDALSALRHHDPDTARLVTLRYFAGLSHQEAADVMGLSRGAADRLWALGRAWLYRRLSK